LKLSDELLDRFGISVSLDALAAVWGERGEIRRAVRLWGAAYGLRETMGVPQPPDDERVLEPFLRAARSRLDRAAWDAAWEAGRAMRLEEAVAHALEVKAQAAPELPPEP
jgi:hypothetical protein